MADVPDRRCPHCLLAVYEDDPNTIWRGRALYHGPCWALAFAREGTDHG